MRRLCVYFVAMFTSMSVTTSCSKKEKAVVITPSVEAAIDVNNPPEVENGANTQLHLPRDPFRRYVGQLATTNIALPSLRYVGFVKDLEGNMALLEDRRGNGYTVRLGSRVGNSGGEVSEINEKEVVVKTLKGVSRLPFWSR